MRLKSFSYLPFLQNWPYINLPNILLSYRTLTLSVSCTSLTHKIHVLFTLFSFSPQFLHESVELRYHFVSVYPESSDFIKDEM